jgi:hypothetical protein
MASELDLETLAHRLATIACATSDSMMGVRLVEVVAELLERAGLLPADSLGGGVISDSRTVTPTEYVDGPSGIAG